VTTTVLWCDDVIAARNSGVSNGRYTLVHHSNWYQVIIMHVCMCVCSISGQQRILTTLTTDWGYDVGMPISWATEPDQTVGNITEYGELAIS